MPECSFAVDHLQFDLCPLLDAHLAPFKVTIDEETPPTHTKNVYVISFGEVLKRDGTLPADLQCTQGTRICLTVINTRPNHPSEPSRILQVMSIAGEELSPKAKLGSVKEGSHHVPLQLTFHGGNYKQQRQKATFMFYCDESLEEPTSPSFLWQFNGTHAFSWRSKFACHKPLSHPQPHVPDADPPQDPPQDPDFDTGGNFEDPTYQFHSLKMVLSVILVFLLASRLLLFIRRQNYSRGHLSLPATTTSHVQSRFSIRRPGNMKVATPYQRAYSAADDDDDDEEIPLTTSTVENPIIGSYGSF